MKPPLAVFIHPEGNISDNPNLSGIVELLTHQGWRVHIYSPRRSQFNQLSPCAGVELILVDRQDTDGCFLFPSLSRADIEGYIRSVFADASVLIGVDRGIIEASCIAKVLKVPYGLISYEITFEAETSKQFKSIEISACRNIEFAMVPDRIRGRELSRENRIPHERLFFVPVAGAGVYRPEDPRPRIFHQRLSLPAHSRVALYMGTVSKWTLCDALLNSVPRWPAHWHLVIHNRRGIDQETHEILKSVRDSRSRIHVSSEAFALVSQMHDFIHSADLGIAFYQPTYYHYNLGRNIKYIGLSSGKTAGYLQHGIPIAVNPNGEMSDWVNKRQLGQVVEDPLAFVPADSVLDASGRCIDFYREHLDLRKTLLPWLEFVGALSKKTSCTRLTELLNKEGSIPLSNEMVPSAPSEHAAALFKNEASIVTERMMNPNTDYIEPTADLVTSALTPIGCSRCQQNDNRAGTGHAAADHGVPETKLSKTSLESTLKELSTIEWFHRIDLGNGVMTPGRDDSDRKLQQLGLPRDLSGKTVLDIGAWDGFFSFAAELRGAAKVVAADIATAKGFVLAKRILKSKVCAVEIDIMDLSPEKVGMFDWVICLGVLYHLKHPLMALERVFSVTAERLILETYVDMLDCPRPAMAFYPEAELNRDPSNWCGPNPAMVIAMLRTVGFTHAEMFTNTFSGNGYADNRAVFHAWK